MKIQRVYNCDCGSPYCSFRHAPEAELRWLVRTNLSNLVHKCMQFGRVLAAALLSCAPAHVTPCGMRAQLGDAPAWEDEVDELEARTLETFAARVTGDERFRDVGEMCRKLSGWQVRTVPGRMWECSFCSPYGRVGGTTNQLLMTIVLATGDEARLPPEDPEYRRLAWSAYSHELAHVVQGVRTRGPAEPGDIAGHEGWTRDGIYAAIDAARNP